MAKVFVLNCKLDADDVDRLVWLARRVQRSKADTVRWLIREATGGPQMSDKRTPFSYVHPEPVGIIGDWEEWGRGGGITNYESGIRNGEGEKGRKGAGEIAPSPLLPFAPSPFPPFIPASEEEDSQ